MRTYDPPPYTAPHARIEARRKGEADRDAFEAALEARYGMPFEKLPTALRQRPPVHPQRAHARRFDYLTETTYRFNYQAKRDRRRPIPGRDREGWRSRREYYLAQIEYLRQAEIEVRKQRAVKKGRGKPLPKNHFAARRDAVERREFAEKQW